MKRLITTLCAASMIALPVLFTGCEEQGARKPSTGTNTTEDRTGDSTPPTTPPADTPTTPPAP